MQQSLCWTMCVDKNDHCVKNQCFYFDGLKELTGCSLKTTGIFFSEQTAIRLSGSSWLDDRNWSSRPWSMRMSSWGPEYDAASTVASYAWERRVQVKQQQLIRWTITDTEKSFHAWENDKGWTCLKSSSAQRGATPTPSYRWSVLHCLSSQVARCFIWLEMLKPE